MIRQKKTRPLEILSGWKSIARHLGMGVRTVQRYERLMGLPIRRPNGRMQGSVLATKSELDAWVEASPIRRAFQLANSASVNPSNDLKALKVKVEEMCTLRHQMTALRDEVRDSMRSLGSSIEMLRNDLRPNAWDVPSTLGSNPRTRWLLDALRVEKPGGATSWAYPPPFLTTAPAPLTSKARAQEKEARAQLRSTQAHLG